MKVLVIGGGPAGLYASLLLKKGNPAHDITLLERNPADATYGWGVVFSDTTLTEFREADYPSYEDITDHFALWDAIDIRYRGEVVRGGGLGFAGISRKTLLELLQRRCHDVGVDMRFDTEVTDVETGKADVVIAADGVNSVARRRYADVFLTRLAEGRARYIWFGTRLPLDSFTFIFRESEHGLFQVHAYPFDGETSTFIVECEEEVWRRARLDRATTEESIAFCEKLFAPDLRGSPLLSNKSEWARFVTVRNRTWHHENVVLLGDAAHTAHFTIGSGTKLAMEDAIALSRAFGRYGEDVERALGDYEMERRPVVERFQDAARQSRIYFENTGRYLHMEPVQFAIHLLTRSGRIDYDNLRLRDPRFIDSVDRWFSGRSVAGTPPAFVPLQVRDTTFPNRIVALPRSAPARDGTPETGDLDSLVEAAGGGAGVVLTDVVAMSAHGRITATDPGLYREEHVSAWQGAIERIHDGSEAKVGVQLGHAGRRGSTRPRNEGLDRLLEGNGWPLLAPSPLPYTPSSQTPKEMDRAHMDRVREDFAVAAGRAAEAGADLLIVHMAHGYLLSSFLSPLTNVRTDEYGGSLEKRARFPLEVLDAVHSVWPVDRPLGVAVNATDWARGGFTETEAVDLARMLKDRGCDLILVLAGQTTPDARPRYGPMFLAEYSDLIRNEVRIPTMTAGAITTTGQASTIVASGRADLCVLDANALYAPTS